jgi:hypothetical protein
MILFSAAADALLLQQNQRSSTVTSSPDGRYEGAPSKVVDAPKLDAESLSVSPLRAAPLSNQERLVLRKQALQMKKRPVLSIGSFVHPIPVTTCTHFKLVR